MTWKTFEETISRGRNRSTKAWLVMDDNNVVIRVIDSEVMKSTEM
jgi:hypothetical protein